jgi:plasmid maintenance system antidote protein VapI
MKRTPTRVPSPSDQLAALIRGSGQTPAALASAAGVAPSVLSRFLNGRRGLTSDTIDRLAVALGGVRLETAKGRGRGRPQPDNPTPASCN